MEQTNMNIQEEDDITRKAKEAFKRMREAAEKYNLDMSMEEIDAEIKAVREERRKRNGTGNKIQ